MCSYIYNHRIIFNIQRLRSSSFKPPSTSAGNTLSWKLKYMWAATGTSESCTRDGDNGQNSWYCKVLNTWMHFSVLIIIKKEFYRKTLPITDEHFHTECKNPSPEKGLRLIFPELLHLNKCIVQPWWLWGMDATSISTSTKTPTTMADKLIPCVSTNQALFDQRDANYKDNDLKENKWQGIRSVS